MDEKLVNPEILTAQDIGRAYTGNTRGLRKYNLGLTQAELTTSSYVDVQARLNTLFGGASSTQLQTYAGQMSLLSVAAGEASETIGKGLIDAMITLTESKDVTDFVNKIDSVAQSISNVIGSVGRFSTVIKGLFTGASPEEIRAIFDPARNAAPLTSSNVLSVATLQKQEAARKKAEADAAKRSKELAALQKKNLDTQKKSLVLRREAPVIGAERPKAVHQRPLPEPDLLVAGVHGQGRQALNARRDHQAPIAGADKER